MRSGSVPGILPGPLWAGTGAGGGRGAKVQSAVGRKGDTKVGLDSWALRSSWEEAGFHAGHGVGQGPLGKLQTGGITPLLALSPSSRELISCSWSLVLETNHHSSLSTVIEPSSSQPVAVPQMVTGVERFSVL